MIDVNSLGKNCKLMAKLIDQNQTIKKLLSITTIDPLKAADIPESLLNKNIKLVPLIKANNNNTESEIAIIIPNIRKTDNSSYNKIEVKIAVGCPLVSWVINDDSLRPFLIISELEKMLDGLRIDGIGVMTLKMIDLSYLDDDFSIYELIFHFDDDA